MKAREALERMDRAVADIAAEVRVSVSPTELAEALAMIRRAIEAAESVEWWEPEIVQEAKRRLESDCEAVRESVMSATVAIPPAYAAAWGELFGKEAGERNVQSCGHPLVDIVSSDEGTSYCAGCEAEARKEAGDEG